jgi:hypothetical protein
MTEPVPVEREAGLQIGDRDLEAVDLLKQRLRHIALLSPRPDGAPSDRCAMIEV